MIKQKMIKLKVPSEGKSFNLLVVVFIIIVVVVMSTVLYENWREANYILTITDMAKCNQELGHVNYPECLKYLHDTDQKDFSALWGADPTLGALDYE